MPAKKVTTPLDEPTLAVANETLPLTGDRQRLFDEVKSRWSLNCADEALLRNACECLERAAIYSAVVTKQGGTFVDRFGGVKANPAAMLERDYRGLASRTLKELANRLGG